MIRFRQTGAKVYLSLLLYDQHTFIGNNAALKNFCAKISLIIQDLIFGRMFYQTLRLPGFLFCFLRLLFFVLLLLLLLLSFFLFCFDLFLDLFESFFMR